jgi:hypothetical protein
MHLGRKDFQVKIRGHRVEIAEIEMALLDHHEVEAAVVVARDDQPGGPRLVGYIVPARGAAPTVSSLRRVLATTCPDYMIPATFVFLEAMPLTTLNKVDRRALPAPSRCRPALASPFVAPRTPIETKLAQLWASTLGLEEVGIHDNFLDLGGHSLLATQIITQTIHTLQAEVPVQTLFDSPTVAEMATVIVQHLARQSQEIDVERLLSEVEANPDVKSSEQ